MNENLYHKENMLSYVNEVPPSDLTPPALPEDTQRNGLAVTGLVLTILSFFVGVFIIPPVVAIGFSVAGLITAIKRGTSKVMSIISLILAILILIVSTGIVAFIFLSYNVPKTVNVPLNYSMDNLNGIAYKYDPATRIKCDEEKNCTINVSLIATKDACLNGGQIQQTAVSGSTSTTLSADPNMFPAIKRGEKQTTVLTFHSPTPNDTLLIISSPVIVCN